MGDQVAARSAIRGEQRGHNNSKASAAAEQVRGWLGRGRREDWAAAAGAGHSSSSVASKAAQQLHACTRTREFEHDGDGGLRHANEGEGQRDWTGGSLGSRRGAKAGSGKIDSAGVVDERRRPKEEGELDPRDVGLSI